MRVRVFADERALGRAAAAHAAEIVQRAVAARGKARLLAAAGHAQGALCSALVAQPELPWGNVELFHDGEFLGVGAEHPGALRKDLCDRLIARTRIGRYHLLDGERDAERVCREEGEALAAMPVDLALAGIGDGGELAFNLPPADFSTERPYFIARLDDLSRQRHVQAAGFASAADVPERAITISIRQLLKSVALIACAPGAAKAEAVRRCVEGAVSPLAPASILQTHPDATLYLDRHSAALLTQPPAPED